MAYGGFLQIYTTKRINTFKDLLIKLNEYHIPATLSIGSDKTPRCKIINSEQNEIVITALPDSTDNRIKYIDFDKQRITLTARDYITILRETDDDGSESFEVIIFKDYPEPLITPKWRIEDVSGIIRYNRRLIYMTVQTYLKNVARFGERIIAAPDDDNSALPSKTNLEPEQKVEA